LFSGHRYLPAENAARGQGFELEQPIWLKFINRTNV